VNTTISSGKIIFQENASHDVHTLARASADFGTGHGFLEFDLLDRDGNRKKASSPPRGETTRKMNSAAQRRLSSP